LSLMESGGASLRFRGDRRLYSLGQAVWHRRNGDASEQGRYSGQI